MRPADAGSGHCIGDHQRRAHPGLDLGARGAGSALAKVRAARDRGRGRDRGRARPPPGRPCARRGGSAAVMTARGLIVSAPRSGAGKTTVTLALLAALARRGTAVRAAKAGPDYIDLAFHAAATGAPSVNLDSWAMAPPLLDALAREATRGADVLIVEGVMGLFDGVAGAPGRGGATADLAARFALPV